MGRNDKASKAIPETIIFEGLIKNSLKDNTPIIRIVEKGSEQANKFTAKLISNVGVS